MGTRATCAPAQDGAGKAAKVRGNPCGKGTVQWDGPGHTTVLGDGLDDGTVPRSQGAQPGGN